MKLIVFDMDGTLVDSGAEIARRVCGAFERLGLPQPPEERVRANVGLSLPLYMRVVAETDDETLVDQLVDAYRAIAGVSPSGLMPLFPGAREALSRLQQRPDTVLGVATGKGSLGLRRAIEQNALEGLFVTLQTPDTNPSKPNPGMLLSAMRETGAEPHETVMIGDAVFDIAMAVAAGVASVGVAWGLQPSEALMQAGADAIAPDFASLDATIDRVLETAHA